MTDQYGRKIGLVLVQGERGLDLSEFRIQFEIVAADVESPNTAFIRVYNLSEATAQKIRGEYSRVVLNAGYEAGAYGVIFDGTIKQVRRGRQDAITSYVDIFAADGDLGYNFGVVNTSLAAGSTPVQRADAIAKAWEPYGIGMGTDQALQSTGGILPRGKVLFGMARYQMRQLTRSTMTSWSIQDGKVTIIPLTGYLESEALVLNSQSGMIGVPEATDNGILIRSLLNPKVRIGTRVQINNRDVNQTTVVEQGFPNYTSLSFPANVTDDGFYRVLVAEHFGDSRGQEWYTDMVCLSIDPSLPPDQSVKAFG